MQESAIDSSDNQHISPLSAIRLYTLHSSKRKQHSSLTYAKNEIKNK
ncbi:hypothetical protein EDWATA_02990 [Edwardsiella tarda ATCC 23685]|uniref:Uncharacterized protein n=1 Tax=Edwardsiella tarda ATCC 23685 TaxID=500638 RepID=D4F8A3_EDWTA|nr:hypothetical protein EDWATA_02990 [Edwardsiella tarda ATCC 23685]